MKTLTFSFLVLPLTVLWAGAAQEDEAPKEEGERVALSYFEVPEGLEVTVWATTPQLYNPTNIDIDAAGRIWACEGVRYRYHRDRKPEGDRVVVMEDSDGDGKADKSHTFVQEEGFVAPLGIGVIDNRIYVSQPPELIVYTDVDRNLVYEEGVDKREVLFTGFNGRNHDHSLHSVTAGPGGKLYFNTGNCGAIIEDREGNEFVLGGPYRDGGGEFFTDNVARRGERSDDGHLYHSAAIFRMNADGSDLEVIGHGSRNSYEQSVTSGGDVFHSDNDDPAGCRVSYALEYGCAGYFSRDGMRFYNAEKRLGQTHAENMWRQDDPGTMDAGDIYGGGSPTGVAFYENGALGKSFEGTLLIGEPGRNVIFSYQPEAKKGTFQLDREEFVNTNAKREFDGSDFVGGTGGKSQEEMDEYLLFRPSDIAIGPDGALYISDWYDARVGGHAAMDDSCSGTIYRVAPKGFQPRVPEVNLDTPEGALAVLKSPAPNVRVLGFRALAEMGGGALSAVEEFLANEENPFVRMRGIWVLPHLGEEGVAKAVALLKDEKPAVRIAAYRALQRADIAILPYAPELAKDPDDGVRREVALSLRDLPLAKTKEIFLTLAKAVDVDDKNSLEALGLGAALQEDELWQYLRGQMAESDPLAWDDRFAKLTWRIWSPAAVPALRKRALSEDLSQSERAFAVESLAFIDHASSLEAMMDLAAEDSPSRRDARRWLLQRGTGEWSKHGGLAKLEERGLYNPDEIEVTPMVLPEPLAETTYDVEDVLALTGDAKSGRAKAMACTICHSIEGAGPNYGPDLKGWGSRFPREVVVRAIVEPSSDIAHGYEGKAIELKDGGVVHGIEVSSGDPLLVDSMGGVQQMIPRKMVAKHEDFNRSLMLSSEQLGLKAQDVADIVAFLKEY